MSHDSAMAARHGVIGLKISNRQSDWVRADIISGEGPSLILYPMIWRRQPILTARGERGLRPAGIFQAVTVTECFRLAVRPAGTASEAGKSWSCYPCILQQFKSKKDEIIQSSAVIRIPCLFHVVSSPSIALTFCMWRWFHWEKWQHENILWRDKQSLNNW